MKGRPIKKGPRIKDILDKIPYHPYLVFNPDDSIDAVKKRLEEIELVRNIYVIDSSGRLIGYVSLGRLIRFLTSLRMRREMHYHELLEFISTRTVKDLMEEDIVYAATDDYAEEVLDRMIERRIKEAPVVDKDKKIISNIGIIDLWRLTEDLY